MPPVLHTALTVPETLAPLEGACSELAPQLGRASAREQDDAPEASAEEGRYAHTCSVLLAGLHGQRYIRWLPSIDRHDLFGSL
jgi:hypothetical protein